MHCSFPFYTFCCYCAELLFKSFSYILTTDNCPMGHARYIIYVSIYWYAASVTPIHRYLDIYTCLVTDELNCCIMCRVRGWSRHRGDLYSLQEAARRLEAAELSPHPAPHAVIDRAENKGSQRLNSALRRPLLLDRHYRFKDLWKPNSPVSLHPNSMSTYHV